MNILEKQFLNRSIKKIVSSNKMPNFSSSVELAGLALVNKDYSNAQLVYGSILNDIQERGREHELNDLLVYSLHTALAYCCTASKKTEEAMMVLTSLYPSITLPLVPYMRAISNVESQNIQKAVSEISNCEKLMSNGYNFLSNDVLNEHIVPEMDNDVMKVKLEQLRLICMLLRSNDCKEIKDATMTKLLKIDDPDGINLLNYVPRLDMFLDDSDEDEIEQPVKSKKKKGKKGGANAAAKKNTNAISVNSAKKVDVLAKIANQKVEQKNGLAPCSSVSKGGKTRSISLQTDSLNKKCSYSQTMPEKDNGPSNRELLNILQEMKNKMNSQSKKDDEIRRLLQNQVSELTEQLGERQDPLTCPEYVFLKDKFKDLEDKLKQSQQQVVLLQKVLTEQMQHKSRMQATIYATLEAQCYNKISYLCEIQKYLKPGSGHVMSLEECKQQDLMWKSCLRQLGDSKLRFEDYCRNLSDLIFEEKYNLLRPNTWPEMPQAPQVADGVYNSFKKILQSEVSQVSKPKKVAAAAAAAGSAPPAAAASNVVVDMPSVLCRFDKPLAKCVDDDSPPDWNEPPFSSFDGRTTGSPVRQRPRRGTTPTVDVALPNNPFDDRGSNLSRNEEVLGYETEQEIYEFLSSKFQNVDDMEWLEALYQFRDSHGGNLTRIPPDVVVHEIQKIMKQRAQEKKKPAWTTIAPVSNPPKNQERKKHKDDQCIICFEKMKPATSYVLACKHEFHKTCIGNWLKRTNQCPICRANVEKEDYPELPAPMSQ